MLKQLTATALAFIALTSPAHATNVDPGHMALGRAVASTGIDLVINPSTCSERDADGWYSAREGELAICQDNASQAGVEVPWTANDFDTLRHEAHHLIQDCIDGRLDGDLHNAYVDSPAFVTSVLPQRRIKGVIRSYLERGATEAVVRSELEAFAVAQVNDPSEQVADIQRYCH